jgi:hypothetical protein
MNYSADDGLWRQVCRILFCLPLVTGLSVAVTCLAVAAESSDVDLKEVEKGSPTQVEDAYSLDYGELDVEGLFRYEKVKKGHGFVWTPRIEYGFAPNWQGRVSVPILSGETATDEPLGSTLQLEVLRSFQSETGLLPAVALSLEVDLPTGHAARGADTTIKVLVSKTLGKGIAIPQLHLNAAWTHNAGPRAQERHDLYSIILGYSRLLSPRVMMVADFFRQQQFVLRQTENVLEAGVRYALNLSAVVAIGVGYGIGADSRDFHVQTSMEFTFR